MARTHLLLTLGQPAGNTILIRLILLGRRVFYGGYMERYQASAREGEEQLPAWIVVMAAARLNEEIPHEMQALLKIVKDGLKA